MSYSYNSATEESLIESDNDFNMETDDNVKPTAKKPSTSRKKDTKINKNVNRMKTKKNTSYLENIEKMMKNEKIDVENTNSMSVKQGDGVLNIKLMADEKCTDYWTLSHYKTANIKSVDVKDRWKEAECNIKIAITDQPKDYELANNFSDIVQSIFTRFMSDPKRKIARTKISKS